MDGLFSALDGKILATAAAQMKIFNLSDHKKIQKFSGHPVSFIFIPFSFTLFLLWVPKHEYMLKSAYLLITFVGLPLFLNV